MTRSSFLCHCKLPKTHENMQHTVDARLCGRAALSCAVWRDRQLVVQSCSVHTARVFRECGCESWKCTGVSSVTECGCHTPVNNRTVCERNRIKDSNTGLTTVFCCCVNVAYKAACFKALQGTFKTNILILTPKKLQFWFHGTFKRLKNMINLNAYTMKKVLVYERGQIKLIILLHQCIHKWNLLN